MHTQEQRSTANEILNVNAGLFVLRRILAGAVPADFEWWFRVSDNGVAAGWVWKGGALYQAEIERGTVADLVRDWWRVNWRVERARARDYAARVAKGAAW